jgi:hypothetical protein
MFLFSHPWAALLMCTSGVICLKTLGLTVSSVLKTQRDIRSLERDKNLPPETAKDTIVTAPDTLETGYFTASPLH